MHCADRATLLQPSAWKGSALREIEETGWKGLRRLYRPAVERFWDRVLAEVERVMHKSTESASQRYRPEGLLTEDEFSSLSPEMGSVIEMPLDSD